jgi:hypothetical protein
MKLIVREDQYRKISNSEECPTAMTFEVYDPIRKHWKKRTRCISQEFYDLINENYKENIHKEVMSINKELKLLINEYFDSTYYYSPKDYYISSITPWRVLIVLKSMS